MRTALITLFLFMISLFGQAQSTGDSYDKLWKAVEVAMNNGQPRTAQRVLEGIEKKAVQDKHFAQTLAARVGLLKCQTDVEPDSFSIMADRLERQYADVKNAADRAVAHAVFIPMYNELVGSWDARYDNDIQTEMRKRRDEHFSHLFDDMEALASAKAEAYKPLTELQKDGAVYGHDMLAVMVTFAERSNLYNGLKDSNDLNDIRRKAAAIYAKRGQKEAEAMMLLPTLTKKEDVHELLMRMKDSDVGMDIAAKYMAPGGGYDEDDIEDDDDDNDETVEAKRVAQNDETLRFIRWAKENVKMSGAWVNLEAREKEIMRPRATVCLNSACKIAGMECSVDIKYNNVERVLVEVRKFNGYKQTKNRGQQPRTDGAVVATRTVLTGRDEANMARKGDGLPVCGKASTSFTLEAGHYVAVCKMADSGEESVSEFNTTTMKLIAQTFAKNKAMVYVVDAITGRPLKGIKVSGRGRTNSVVEQHTTDEQGMAMFTADIHDVQAERSTGDFTNWTYVGSFYSPRDNSKNTKASIFCDRAIYRPGHTVKGNALVYIQNGDEVAVKPNAQLRLRISSPSGLWEKEFELKANTLGTADFEIELPDDAEVGSYAMNVDLSDGSVRWLAHQNIKVEEYKRPTFEVTLHHQSDYLDSATAHSFSFGDTIMVEGKALSFADVPVQGAEVEVEIERGHGSWRWSVYDWESIDDLELTTDSEGRFIVPVHLDDADFQDDIYSHCVFRVRATVTDQSGETREGEWTVRVGKREYELLVNVKGRDNIIDLDDKPCFTVMARNTIGLDVKAEGDYWLVMGTDTVATGRFTTGEPIAIDSKLPFGPCELCLKSIDSKGNVVKYTASLTLLHKAAKAYTFEELVRSANANEQRVHKSNGDKVQDFIYSPTREVSEQQPADIFFAPDADDSYIYYSVFAGERLVESKQAVLGSGQHRITVPYKREYGNGFTVRMFYVRNGRLGLIMNRSFTYVKPDKRLKLSWSTFRDKLQPGAKEEWVLNVKDKNGKAVNGAEMMAVMYDAALDRIAKHNWRFNLAFPRNLPNYSINDSYLSGTMRFSLNAALKTKTFIREYDYLKPYEHNRYIRRYAKNMSAAPMMARGMAEIAVGSQSAMDVEEDAAIAGPGTLREVAVSIPSEELYESKIMTTEDATSDDFSNATVRSNFAETAFFMPHLVSDYVGNVRIAFTLPESLTEWQFRALAHTAAMDYGMIDTTAVARKLFMVRPNMPRFVRHGDMASIASSIINQSESALSGTVRMRLINPETDEEVLVMKEAFSVEAGQTTNVAFSFPVLESYEGMDCEIIAVSGDTSDGEKNHLPVLTTKQEMVETVPFYLIGDEEKTIDLSALFNENSKTATNRKLAIDYTASPAWMCIDALRSMSLPEYDDAISLAAAYHANTRLLGLLDYPSLALDSIFSQKTLTADVASARDRLKKLQLGDGGWSWFAGMKSNYYTTLAVCEQLALIPNRTDEAEAMLTRGMKFLDEWEMKEYNERKRLKDKNMTPSSSTLRYLYVSSKMPQRKVASGVETMRKAYLTAIDKQLLDLTMYGVANASCALRAFGFTKTADKFVESLRQHTTTRPNQGRFFATDAAYYSWMDYRIPTQTAAMRAIAAQNTNDPYLNDMTLWLIAQKQVQKWDNPINTIDVVDILLDKEALRSLESLGSLRSLGSLKSLTTLSLTIDGTPVKNFRTATLNTERDKLEGRAANLEKMGNVVADIDAELISNGVKSMTVAPLNPPQVGGLEKSPSTDGKVTSSLPPLGGRTVGGLSWGFAQATFTEDMSRVKRYATNELSVDRKLYVQRNNEWVEVKGKTVLAVGDKVRIRHTVKADRDMDFVRLTAQHPACFEPVKALSGYQWLGTRGGYVGIHDSHTTVSFDWFTRGSATIDTEYYVARTGEYEVGISTVECAYAKQFGGHTAGMKIVVSD